jgi:spore maturation protein CgeB
MKAPVPLPLTFVGSMYPDRVRQLEKLRAFGIDIEVNPHRGGRTDRPSYAEYAAAIKNSWATLNFSRNHGMPSKHVKTRVLEAPLFGTVLFSDEKKLSSKILPQEEFVFFRNKRDLKRKILFYSQHPQELEKIRVRGAKTATIIANSIFWDVIEEAIVRT